MVFTYFDSNVRYEILRGNYGNKFVIDGETGLITLAHPLISKKPAQGGIAKSERLVQEGMYYELKRTINFEKSYYVA